MEKRKNSRKFDFASKAFDERDAMIVKMRVIKKELSLTGIKVRVLSRSRLT